MNQFVTVLDCGSDAQLVGKTIRGLGVYSEVETELSALEGKKPSGIVIVGAEDCREDMESAANYAKANDLKYICFDPANIESNELEQFLVKECGISEKWDMKKFVKDSTEEIRNTVGNKKVLCALSGGVDSSVVAALLHKAVGNQLICIFVDTGLMRKNEGDEVVAAFKNAFGIDIIRVDAEDRFLGKLKGVTEPEQKRKIIGEEFIRVFEEEGKKIGAVGFLAQGTIYPDIIESGSKNQEVIKSHHNVGGLPDVIEFDELIEPLKYLFKDEVRQAGRELGLSDDLVMRQPFPGPGLAVRCIGEITKEKLDILREADFIFRDEIKKSGWDTKIWQYFAIMTGLRSVGAKDGKRSYGYTIALRAVNSVDAMTGVWVKVPFEVLEAVSERIVSEVKECNRVVFDITNKPPGTIEWE